MMATDWSEFMLAHPLMEVMRSIIGIAGFVNIMLVRIEIRLLDL